LDDYLFLFDQDQTNTGQIIVTNGKEARHSQMLQNRI